MITKTPIQGPVLRSEFARRLGEARDALFQTLALTVEEIASLAPPAPGAPLEDGAQQSATTVLSQLEEREWRELAEILAAQARLEAGRFGLCLRCGEAIPLARLRAMPATRYCVACQAQEEKR
jgi:RNA polymerase-binding transcription factor